MGASHDSTLYSMHCLALTYLNQGRLEDAKALLVEVVQERKRVLDMEHPLTLCGMQGLAKTHQSQECWNEGSDLSFESSGKQARTWSSHASTLDSMHNLAFICFKQYALLLFTTFVFSRTLEPLFVVQAVIAYILLSIHK